MKTIGFVLALLCLIQTSVFADDAAMDKARELIKVMEVTKYMDQSFAQMEGFADQMIAAQTDLTPEQMADAREAAKTSMAASMNAMKTIDWEGVFADIYGAVFTADEMQGLIDFYTSDIGQKMLAKQPELMTQTMQRMQGEMQKIMPQIQADVKQAVMDARQKHEEPEVPAPAVPTPATPAGVE